MLSDEEKKEYEELKSLLYTGTISQYGKRKLIDIIEKQSKEIEELKAISEYREKIIKGLGLKTLPKTITGFRKLIENNDKKWKDKIKAKIEEINKEMLNEENSLELFYRKKYCKEVLQSLLDKE